ncbi:MAG: indolepyruvate ferredoxin oxidoreductase subunit alpha [Peptococcaceae bacterium]|nr:indolepyruvate ferredoxin oxidoreductase subunit alpha [Peptococcaceae bacterium]
MKKLMTGNEAFALGAYLSGIKVGAGYPGTPSTEILMNFARYPGVYAEWSPNEKVALDVGVGAAYAGGRALVTTKHVGMNVAADSLFYVSYTGMQGGLVIVNADDPEMHSSQNEQDNRYYAKFAKVPMLEPADSQEAVEFVKLALEISETYDTPVIVRTNTRLSHSKSVVEVPAEDLSGAGDGGAGRGEEARYVRNIPKYVMVPGFARQRHPVVIDRLEKLAAYAETTPVNYIVPGGSGLGVICAGVVYQYAREVFPDAAFLKLGMVYPLPRDLIIKLASMVERVVVVEELEPFIEEHVRLLGIPAVGKEVFSRTGELSPEKVRRSAARAGLIDVPPEEGRAVSAPSLPARPPMLCPGCAHRGIFYALQRVKAVVLGDIGCYTLGALPPLNAMHSCGCMGASIGVVHGVDKVGVKDRTVAVIGDSTFFHSGIPPLINVLYNRGVSTVIILDNRITAMTGHQENPGSGRTLMKDPTAEISIEKLVRGIGFEKVDVINPYEFKEVLRVIKEHVDSDQPSVIVARYPCILNIRERKEPLAVDPEACNMCGNCLQIGCSPIAKREGGVSIDPSLCIGCGLCASVCPRKAISHKPSAVS